MYVCGPTVYDLPHIGHGRANLTFDILRRYLSFTGLRVHHVANVTDVDDNIIKRAAELGRTEPDVAAEFEARWWESMDALGDLRPQDVPHATQYIEDMVALVGDLVARGMAYETPDGVYLEVSKVDGYGLLARQSLESLQAGARVEANEDKRSPLDFALWKKAKAGRAELGVALGAGPAGMAHRVRRDVARPAGRGVRPARWRPGPHVPASRERAGAGGRGRQGLRPALDAPRLGRGRGHEDVQVPGQLLDAARPAVALRRPRLQAPRAPRPLPLAHRGDARDAGRRREGAGPAWTAWPVASTWPSFWPGREDGYVVEGTPPATDIDPGASAAFRAHMDDDLDTPGALAGIFELVTAAHSAADAGDEEEGGRLARTAAVLAAALGLSLRAADTEVDEESARLVAATRPGPPVQGLRSGRRAA